MHIAIVKVKKTGYEYVYLKESRVDPKTGKTTKRIVKNYGRRDILERDYPGKLEELQERYKPRARRAYEAQALAIASETFVDDKLSNEEVHDRRFDIFNYGWLIFRWIWSHILHLEQPFTYLNNVKYHYTTNSKGETDTAFSMNTIASMLACRKAMGGASILKTFNDRGNFLGMPKENLSQAELYRFLGYLEDNRDYIVKSINTQLDNRYGKERYTLLYYDATNTFFEVPMTDEERGIVMPDYEDRLIELIEAGISNGELDSNCITEDGLPNYEQLPESFMNDVDKRCIKYLRQRGHSKEQRMDLPLISIVLVIDNNGIPVDYAVFPGNQSEFTSMEPVIQGLRVKYHIENAIVVADKGLNSTSNLDMLENNGMGYVVAQKISQLGKDLTAQITSLKGYTRIETSDGHERRYKVIENYTKTAADGTSVNCTLVVTFDANRKKHDDAVIEKNVSILMKKIEEKTKIKSRRTGWKAFAKIENSGTDGLVVDVDNNVLAKRRALAGFAGFVFKAPKMSDGSVSCQNITADYIAGFYGKLNSIERCFRIMKHNLGLRPVFVRKAQHINAHVLLCFIALVQVCVLEKTLHDAGHMISIDQMLKVLNSMQVTRINSSKEAAMQEPMYLVSKTEDQGTYRYVDPETHEESEVNLAYAPYNILRTLNMSVPPSLVSKTALAGCLRTQFRAPSKAGSIYL